MKKIVLLYVLLFALRINAQQTIITQGRTTIEIKISRQESGTMYYVLYNTLPIITPTAQTIKTDALASTLTNADKRGTLKIGASEINTLLKKHLSGITGTITNTDRPLFLYVVFENDASGFESVIKKDIILKRRQIAQAFKCTRYPHSDTAQLYYKPFNINCLVYYPESYFHDITNKKYPLLLSMHGNGEKGTNELDLLRGSFIPGKLESTSYNVEFVVVSPQTNGYKPGWQTPIFLKELLDTLTNTMKIDTNKVYAAGFSGGSGGLCYFSHEYGTKLSAISSMSGVNPIQGSTTLSYCKLKEIPLWTYHCLDDGTVSSKNTANLVSGITLCNPPVLPKSTYYPTGGHLSFGQALKTDSLFRFFLSKSKQNILGVPLNLNFSGTYTTTVPSNGIVNIDIAGFPTTAGLTYNWIKVSGNDLTIIDDNSRILKLKDPISGTYIFRVMIIDNKNITSYKDITINITTITGLEDNTIQGYKTNLKNWQIYSIEGKFIKEGQNEPVDFMDLKKGLYIIRHEGGSNKVIID